MSEECIHLLEAAVSRFTDSRPHSLQGGHSVCRLILVAVSKVERADAPQAAAQAITALSAWPPPPSPNPSTPCSPVPWVCQRRPAISGPEIPLLPGQGGAAAPGSICSTAT